MKLSDIAHGSFRRGPSRKSKHVTLGAVAGTGALIDETSEFFDDRDFYQIRSVDVSNPFYLRQLRRYYGLVYLNDGCTCHCCRLRHRTWRAALAPEIARSDPKTRNIVADAASEIVAIIAAELPPSSPRRRRWKPPMGSSD